MARTRAANCLSEGRAGHPAGAEADLMKDRQGWEADRVATLAKAESASYLHHCRRGVRLEAIVGTIMHIATAQEEMSSAHVHGAPGVFVSGVVWLVAGWLWTRHGVEKGFLGLFVGGILIFPVSLLLARLVFRAPRTSPGNPLETLALESTGILFGGIFLAYCFLRVAPELAFPAMAVAIGVRYLIFRSVYGNPVYWGLGGVIAMTGGLVAASSATLPVNLALIVGLIEVGFSIALLLHGSRTRHRSGAA